MRILIIRGQNLASLSGSFEVDLTAEPLASTGLFAITGDTGAGKSTILDALCLALYGEFPRVAGQGRGSVPDPSGEALTPKDAASILRRGTAHGFAEVDFQGKDGKLYRVRWEVARARGKADGKLQKVQRLLTALPGLEAVAHGTKDVLAAVEARSDLNFEQFRRTVLLAQGEFDAFLLADENARAELLEKITGTGIYADISRRIYQGTAERRVTVDELTKRIGDIDQLAPDMRTAKVAERADIDAQTAAKTLERQGLHALLDHAKRRVEAIQALALAERALAAARMAQSDVQAERLELIGLDQIEPLRGQADALEDAKRRRAASEVVVDAAKSSLASAHATNERVQAALAIAQGAHDAWERDTRANQAELREAERLDAELAIAGHELESATTKAGRAQSEAQARETQCATFTERLSEVGLSLGLVEQKLVAATGHAALSERWLAIEAHIAAWRRARAEQVKIEAQSTQARADLEVLRRAEAAANAELQSTHVLRDRQAAQLQNRQEALAAIDEAAVNERLRSLRDAREAVSEGLRLAHDHDEAVADHTRNTEEIAQQEAELAQARQGLAAADASLNAWSERRAQAAPLLALANAAASEAAAILRARLKPGEPCPVCGGDDHPYANSDGSAEKLAQTLRVRQDEIDAGFERATAQRSRFGDAKAAAQAKLDAECRQRASLVLRLSGLELTFTQLAARLQQACRNIGRSDLAAPALGGVAWAALSRLEQEIEQALEAVSVQQKSIEKLRQEIEGLRTLDATLARTLATQTQTLHDDRTQADKTGHALQTAMSRLEALALTLADHTATLLPDLAAGGLDADDLNRDAGLVLSQLKQRIETYRTLKSDQDQLQRKLDGLKAEQATARALCVAASTAHEAAVAALKNRQDEHESKLAARARLLGGESTERYRVRTSERDAQVREARDGARSASYAAFNALTAAQARHQSADEACTLASADCARSEATLAAAAQALGCDLDTALSRLRYDPQARKAIHDRIAKLDAMAGDAASSLANRQQDLARLEAINPDGDALDMEALADAQATLGGQIESLRNKGAQIQAALEQDDAARLRRAGLSETLEAAKSEYAIWAAVDKAAGSQTGDKFRKFAQGVTLDQLVALANSQLTLFSPRYKLARGGGTDLALNILDSDFNQDARAIRSLSGGERFLVSLALALALSSLEGRHAFVDTLFIDEGFGSLDTDTLELAIDALETLQSQGRKVGVITHVAAMIERIAVQVRVEKRGEGRSTVHVRSVQD